MSSNSLVFLIALNDKLKSRTKKSLYSMGDRVPSLIKTHNGPVWVLCSAQNMVCNLFSFHQCYPEACHFKFSV